MTSPLMATRFTLSDKITAFGNRMMLLVMKYGIDIPQDKMCEVNGW
jgi:hypothetical protein